MKKPDFTKISFKNLPINILKEGELYVVVCPNLEISGYGKSIDLAKKSFEIVLEETLMYLNQNGNLFEDLKEHGFEIKNGIASPSTSYQVIGQEQLDLDFA